MEKIMTNINLSYFLYTNTNGVDKKFLTPREKGRKSKMYERII